MESKRVLYVTEEITPYLPETPMSVLCRYLPQGIQERGREVRTFVPKFGNINERRNQLHEVIRLSGMNIIINDNDHPLIIKVASIQAARMQIYFIDNDDFFYRRLMFHDEEGKEYADNGERSIFFNRGTLETVKKLRWNPDLIHCHGWASVLTAYYVRTTYVDDPCYKHSKIVLSLYGDEYQNAFTPDFIDWLQMPGVDSSELAEFAGKEVTFEQLYKLALKYSDGLILASENVNQNIVEYARSLGLPVMEYCGEENYVDKYNDFYELIWSSAK